MGAVPAAFGVTHNGLPLRFGADGLRRLFRSLPMALIGVNPSGNGVCHSLLFSRQSARHPDNETLSRLSEAHLENRGGRGVVRDPAQFLQPSSFETGERFETQGPEADQSIELKTGAPVPASHILLLRYEPRQN